MNTTYLTAPILQEPFIQNAYEHFYWGNNKLIIGIDEVGRGALAGPLVVSAVILPAGTHAPFLKDSKILTDNQKLQAYTWICKNAWFQSSFLSAAYVDKHGIYQATLMGMKKAYYGLISQLSFTQPCGLVLVDAMPLRLPEGHPPIVSLIKGESKSISIAAASIVAKVTRDELMKRMAHYIPQYDFHKNKAYGTAVHCAQLVTRGPSIIHRSTFIKNTIQGNSDESIDRQTSLCS